MSDEQVIEQPVEEQPPAEATQAAPKASGKSVLRRTLEKAVQRTCAVLITYRHEKEARSCRLIYPMSVTYSYIVAFCTKRMQARMFL